MRRFFGTGTLLGTLAFGMAATPAWAEDPQWSVPPAAAVHRSHVRVERRTHMAASGGHRCAPGSGGDSAWLVRGMNLTNFHTNTNGQIAYGAARCP